MSTLVLPFLNLALLLGFLGWKLKGPAKEFISGRHVTLRDELQNVRKKLADAKFKLEEAGARLKAVEAEKSQLREELRAQAKQSRTRIVTEAQRLAQQIVSDAHASAQSLAADFKGSLVEEMGQKILDRAEVFLRERVTRDDRMRIRQEFSRQVESSQ